MLEIHRNPSPRDLRWFGLMMWPFFLFLGVLLYFKAGSVGIAWALWVGSTVFTAAYYALPPLRRPAYVGWMTLVFPLGWILSHAILAVVYYLCVTPIGWALRLTGRLSLRQPADPGAGTYWVPKSRMESRDRYFRQF